MATLRITIPEWHGGMNPDYYFGSELMEMIAPPGKDEESVRIEVDTGLSGLESIDGFEGGSFLLTQQDATRKALEERQPERVVVFGGDCSVTKVPFDYLSGKYGDKLGILWLDAHPDISRKGNTSHLHETPAGDLLGLNQDSVLTKAEHPVSPERFMFAGLITEDLLPKEQIVKAMGLRTASPESLSENSCEVLSWIKGAGIGYVAVHWDLDVLSPLDYRSIGTARPYWRIEDIPYAVGRMRLEEVGRLLKDVSEAADIAGLSITEHIPWDALRMRKLLSSLEIMR